MINGFPIVWILAVLLVVLWMYFQSEDHKKRIIHALQVRGARDITVSTRWFDGDKTTSTYDVTYINQQGQSCQTVCKISTGFFSDPEIFWRDLP
ncbi:hypothetical protein [Leptolyngbya sp. FACHB-1515]|uniref:hypothetical protein n=1 Tax=Leptolyngbya sp. FACHB-1515 TaxID=2933931 RepID=UPI003299CC3A